MGAFLASVVLVLTRSADDGEAIKLMPWRVIVMVCGVTVLISLLEKAQGIDLLVSLVARFSSRETVTGVVALLTGLISGVQQHVGRRAARLSPDGPRAGAAAGRRRSAGHRLVDERRRSSGRRVAALDDRRLVRRRRADR